MNSGRIIALNIRLINGNNIVAIADLQVTAWGITLRRCFWKRGNGRDRIGLRCNGIGFQSGDDAYRLQQETLAAMRAVAKQMLEEPAP
jgi:hypothetical protein